jgi:baseplate J-like protein
MSCRCGCCEGVERITPEPIANRPGLPALSYRAGTHATFLETMQAALSSSEALAALTTRDTDDFSIALLDAWATVADVLCFYEERIANEGYVRTATERRSIGELARLIGYHLRPGVAASTYLAFTLEDGHALVIPRGTRAQSVPGPGELPQPFETSEDLPARSAWNALRPRTTAPLSIDVGGLDFDTGIYLQGLPAVAEGAPMLLIDQAAGASALCRAIVVEPQPEHDRTRVVLRAVHGISGALGIVAAVRGVVERALAEPVASDTAAGKRVGELLGRLGEAAGEDADRDELAALLREQLLPALAEEHELAAPFKRLEPWVGGIVAELSHAERLERAAAADETAPAAAAAGNGDAFGGLARLIGPLSEPPSIPPRNRFALPRTVADLAPPGDAAVRIASAFVPGLDTKLLYDAWGRIQPPPTPGLEVHLLTITGAPFGQNALRQPLVEDGELRPQSEWADWYPDNDEQPELLYLDGAHPDVTDGSYAVIQRPTDFEPTVHTVNTATVIGRERYGLAGKATRLELTPEWWNPEHAPVINLSAAPLDGFGVLRGTVVYAASKQLALAEAPIAEPVQDAEIDLDGVFDGLVPGRWLIVTGDRVLESPVLGDKLEPILRKPILPTVPAAELVMIGGVAQRSGKLPGTDQTLASDTARTWLTLARKLAYTYVRDSVRIYANVIDSTHGETRNEVLGSGDASQALQRFTLKAKPLTYVSALTPEGAQSTLEARVDGIRWHEAPGPAAMGPRDRSYLVDTADDATATIVFGDGRRGQRLPTGVENVEATYRTGIGSGGNLDPQRLTQLVTKPLGVKDVTNPLAATGGADADPADAARHNAPLSVTALDRLVSVQDYEDFARLFAGVGKASAAALSDGRRRLVHVTVAGVADIPIATTSDLFANLVSSLRAFGDPALPIVVAVRRLLLVVIAAKVRVQADYSWPLVEPQVRAALGAALGFDRRELGQDVTEGEVIATIQAVPGVDLVDLDVLDAVGVGNPLDDLTLRRRVRADLAQVAPAGRARIVPAQLAILKPEVPDTLVLTELPG